MKNIEKILAALPFALLLTSCLSSDPANQCLDSFRFDLKDPDSGKVLVFKDNILTYTATNSYGARMQGKALCKKSDGEWTRDRHQELTMISELFTKKLREEADRINKFNACRKAGGTLESCTGKSFIESNANVDDVIENLRKESADELGFN